MYRFWLNIAKDDEYELAAEIEHLKTERGFTTALRDGLRLILSLRRGEFDVLYELFPGIVERVKNDLLMNALELIRESHEEVKAMRVEVARLKRYAPDEDTPPRPKPAAPVVSSEQKSEGNAVKNLLKGMANL